ncbi:PilT domain protein [Pyrobaculum islandicum DSM 4184]|uniref:PilT domain protein n=1 Tax=Pyrobaculum islandicum (strain DSM 4184 / JCM 9189 / GEO3) TaxID=384616 RepID=A1RUQ9_PYRIL|nr:type II toxin-antitoxin system VapC family toxin [Pyrobaculum islandicum]ABL88691.1 PilT domain protein [Pyrobaculum islandicum DSM 4184]
MIAIDASVLAAFLLKEPSWEKLAAYIRQSVSIDLAAKEAANTIWKAYRRGLISRETAYKLFQILLSLLEKNIKLEPELAYLGYAFDIALTHGIAIYDALYISLAMRKGVPLLTLDKTQAEIASKIGVKVVTPFENRS